jgi:hypothetical protein
VIEDSRHEYNDRRLHRQPGYDLPVQRVVQRNSFPTLAGQRPFFAEDGQNQESKVELNNIADEHA